MRKLAFAVLSVVFIAACGGGGGTGQGGGSVKTGGTLRVAQESEIVTLDPMNSGLVVEREIYYNMYDSLIAIDQNLKFIPSLATDWKYNDPTTLTFTLRKGVKFQDGTDFNADAVKFNIDRYLTDPKSLRKSELASVDSVEVKDPQTAVFHLKKPDATLLAQLVDRAGMMLSPAAVKAAGANFSVSPANAGTGPFQFVEWKRDDHLTLKKNPSYWRKDSSGRQLPYLDQVIYHPMTNLDAILAGLKTNDLDLARTISAKDVSAVKSDSTLVYKDTPALGFQGFEVNSGAEPFNDPKKRQAVALALDRAQYLKNVQFDVGVVSYGPIPPASWAADPSEKIYDKADPEKAKSTATGFSFTLKTGNTQDAIQGGQLIQAQLAKAGITVTLAPEDFGKLTTETRAHQFQAAASGWSGRIDPDGNMYAWFHTGGSFNDGQYSNPTVDSDLEQARLTTDQTKRKQLYDDAQKTLVQDGAYMFIYHPTSPQISTTKVHNFVLIPDGINRFTEVYLA